MLRPFNRVQLESLGGLQWIRGLPGYGEERPAPGCGWRRTNEPFVGQINEDGGFMGAACIHIFILMVAGGQVRSVGWESEG